MSHWEGARLAGISYPEGAEEPNKKSMVAQGQRGKP